MEEVTIKKILALLEQAKKDDAKAREEFFAHLRKLYLSRTRNILWSRYGSFKHRNELEKDAEDIVQVFCLTVLTKWEKVERAENGYFIRWANVVHHHIIGAYVRGNRRWRELFDLKDESTSDIYDADSHEEDQVALRDQIERMTGAIKKLSETCQKILGFFLEALSKDEIWEKFPNEDRNVLYKRLHDCRVKLKKLLEANGIDYAMY